MSLFFDLDMQKLQAVNDQRDAAANDPSITPDLAAKLADFHTRYPWMDPEAKWSLASSGIDPQSPEGQAAGMAAAQVKAQTGMGFDAYGTPVMSGGWGGSFSRVAQRVNATIDQTMRPPDLGLGMRTQIGKPASAVQEIAREGDWFGLPQNVRNELDQVQFAPTQDPNQYAVTGAENLSPDAQSALYKILNQPDRNAATRLSGPWAKGELNNQGQNMVQWQLDHAQNDADRAQIQQQIQTDPKYQGPNTVTFYNGPAPDAGPVMGGTNILAEGIPQIAPPLRVGSMVLSAPLQELQGQIRNIYELASQRDNPNWLQSQSDLGIAAGDLLSGRKVDVGSGILVDPTSQVVQERQRRELQRGTVNGEAFTVGRGLATAVGSIPGLNVIEPGSQQYQLLSGLVDAAIAFKADPAALAMREGAAFREADSMFSSPGSIAQGFEEFHNGGSISDALKAFHDAGGLSSWRPTVSPAGAQTYLTGPEGQDFVNALARTDDTYTIMRAFKGRIDPNVAYQISQTDDPNAITKLLGDQLGTTVAQKPALSDLTGRGILGTKPDGPIITPSVPSKWNPNTMMPAGYTDGNSGIENVAQLERVAALTKSPIGRLQDWVEQMAQAKTPMERDAVAQQVIKDIGSDNPQLTDRILRMRQDEEAVQRLYATQRIGDGMGNMPSTPVVKGAAVDNIVDPTMEAQMFDGTIRWPDFRAIRRAIAPAPWQYLMSHDLPAAAIDKLAGLENVWRGLQVMTNKTAVKVIGDEQAALAARGYIGLFNHPIQAAGIIIGSPQAELPEDQQFMMRLRDATSGELKWSQLPGAVTHAGFPSLRHAVASGVRSGLEAVGIEPRVTAGLTEDFSKMEGIGAALSHGFNDSLDSRGLIFANDWKPLYWQPGVNDDEYAKWLANTYAQHASSPSMVGFARADTLQEAKDSFWGGALQDSRLLMSKNGRTGIPELLNEAGSNAWVEKRMAQIDDLTNGNPELKQAIAEGRLPSGTEVFDHHPDGTPTVSKQFTKELRDNYLQDSPGVVPQQKAFYSSGLARQQLADGVFSRMINVLMGTPSRVLSKSPLFRQAYWEKVTDIAPFMTADAQNEAIRVATEEANLPRAMLNDLTQSIAAGNRASDPFAGTLDLDTADTIAKAHGLDMVQRTTHDFSQRSQLFDALRLVSPFGDVWRKSITRWANIAVENPQVIRRVQQGYEALRSPGLGKFMGAPTVMQNGVPVQQGFFHQDGNGNEVFTIPFSQAATQALTGMPVPLVGNVKGLSLGTEFFPALGPVVQFPVAWTLSKLGLANQNLGPIGTLGDLLFPYGAPKTDLGSVVDGWNYAPSWMKNAFGENRPTSPDSVRTFNNTVIDYLRLGLTQGTYDLSTTDGFQAAIQDATAKAHELDKIRGAAQFFIPGAPAPQMLVADKTGKLTDAAALIQEYNAMENGTSKLHPEANANNAAQIFLQTYGTKLFEAMTPKTYSYIFNIPTSADAQKWVDDNPAVKNNLPSLFGYFAPPSDPTKFDYDLYRQQLTPGAGRQELSPDQWLMVATSRLAAKQYGFARQRVIAANGGKDPDAGQRAWLAQVRQKLIDTYPGYRQMLAGGPGLPSRLDPTKLAQYTVPEARKALDIPAAAQSETGKGLALFLPAWDRASAAWKQSGRTSDTGWLTSTSSDAVALRDWVRGQADKAKAQFPRFGPLFDDLFDRAMRTDAEATPPPGG